MRRLPEWPVEEARRTASQTGLPATGYTEVGASQAKTNNPTTQPQGWSPDEVNETYEITF